MYATCLFCHASLGANESIENFPVGKRLAFDSAKGRLWVVCGKCARWNLSPIEERWEAIEEAERAYRDTKKRVATDNVGLARLRDGTDLIRIGEPLRPEFAAWRYGRSLIQRRRRELLVGAGLGGSAIAAIALAAPFVGTAVIAGSAVAAFQIIGKRGLMQPGVRLLANDGSLVRVTGLMLQMSSVIRQADGEFSVNVIRRTAHSNSPLGWITRKSFKLETAPYMPARFAARDAARALSVLMPAINRFGGAQSVIRRAVQTLEKRGNFPNGLLANLSNDELGAARRVGGPASTEFLVLSNLPAPIRLALEMSVHEDSERRALEGELQELQRRWKEAEEIAAISDGMFLPGRSAS